MTDPQHLSQIVEALDDSDPFVAQAAQFALSRQPLLDDLDWTALREPSQRIGLLAGMRYTGDHQFLEPALADVDPAVRLMAVRWIADEQLREYRPHIERAMGEPVLTPRLFAGYRAALERLDDRGTFTSKPGTSVSQYLRPKLLDPYAPSSIKVMALQMLTPDTKLLRLDEVRRLLDDADPRVRLEAVRWLCETPDPNRSSLLAEIAADSRQPAAVRAEALIGLAADAEQHTQLLNQLASSSDAAVAQEARRTLPGPANSPDDRPPVIDLDGWLARLDGQADALAGRRTFFHPKLGGCYRCHRVHGRGADIGPDLSDVGRRFDRRALLESILQPGKEISPRYAAWQVTLADGRSLVALLVGENGGKHRYADAAGQVTEVDAAQVVDRKMLPLSIMPDGLVHAITDQELRDLLAYLIDP